MAHQNDSILNNDDFNMYDGPEVSWSIATTNKPEHEEWNQFWDEWWWLHGDTVASGSLFMEGMPPPDELSRGQVNAMNVRMGNPRPMISNDPMVGFDVDFN